MTITKVTVRQVTDRRDGERRQGERRVQCEIVAIGYERRHNAEFRVSPRRQGTERRAIYA
jgi:hypothetical protein